MVFVVVVFVVVVFVVVVFVVTVVVVVTPIAGNTSSKNMIDGEIAAVVVAVVIVDIVDSAEADMVEFGNKTMENRPCIGNMASQSGAESNKASSRFRDVLGVQYPFLDGWVAMKSHNYERTVCCRAMGP